jgi:hypothetical protein
MYRKESEKEATFSQNVHRYMTQRKKKPNRGPRPTPTGLRPQHPRRGGTEGGNDQQHETQAAAQELTESDARKHI